MTTPDDAGPTLGRTVTVKVLILPVALTFVASTGISVLLARPTCCAAEAPSLRRRR
jgi:hypothetical protein